MTAQLSNQIEGGSSSLTSPLQLLIKIIPKRLAKDCYSRWHYFGGKDFLASYNFGVYFEEELLGAISYGIPNAKNIKGIYTSETQGEYMELTRFALSELCPKNSESRVIAVSLKIVKKLRFGLKGIITYADTAQGHTGIIYRASNFLYHGLTAKKTDLFVNGKKVGKLKGIKYHDIKGEWRPRSQKHLFVFYFDRSV